MICSMAALYLMGGWLIGNLAKLLHLALLSTAEKSIQKI